MGSDTHEPRSSLSVRNGVTDLELPFPQLISGLPKAKFDALAIHPQSSDSPREKAIQKRDQRTVQNRPLLKLVPGIKAE
jgi:hypothetical protein